MTWEVVIAHEKRYHKREEKREGSGSTTSADTPTVVLENVDLLLLIFHSQPIKY